MDQSLVASSIAVTVLCIDLKPDLQEVKISLVFRYSCNWSEIILKNVCNSRNNGNWSVIVWITLRTTFEYWCHPACLPFTWEYSCTY